MAISPMVIGWVGFFWMVNSAEEEEGGDLVHSWLSRLTGSPLV
jgi:hypothetical protein